jgi:polyisoprenoid-binding protein YceI
MFRPLIAILTIALLALTACGNEPALPTAVPAAPTTETQTQTEPPAGYPAVAAPAQPETAAGYPAAVADSAPTSEMAEGYPIAEAVSSDSGASNSRQFVIVPESSTARYVVAETFLAGAPDRFGIPAGLTDTIGQTQAINGAVSVDFGQSPIALEAAEFTVDISTLSSDQSMRDNTLRDRFLQSGQYPIATFVATGVENFPATYTEGEEVTFDLVGNITIREVTQPVTWVVTATLTDGVLSGTAVAPLTMSNFGVEPPAFSNLFTVEDAFRVEVDFVAQEQ